MRKFSFLSFFFFPSKFNISLEKNFSSNSWVFVAKFRALYSLKSRQLFGFENSEPYQYSIETSHCRKIQ